MRQRRTRKKPKPSRSIWFRLLTQIASLAAPIGLLLLLYQTTKIHSFICIQDDQECPPAIQAELNRYHGLSLFNLNIATLKDKLYNVFPQLDTVSYQLTYSLKPKLTLTTTSEIAQLSVASASSALIVGGNHKIISLAATPSAQLPLVITPHAAKLVVGSSLKDHSLTPLIDTAVLLKNSFIPYSHLDAARPSKAIIHLSPQTRAFLDTTSNLDTQITRLQLILNQFALPELVTIDTRFAKPILVFHQ